MIKFDIINRRVSVVIFRKLFLALFFLLSCNRIENNIQESKFYFYDTEETLSLHGNWRINTNPDYDPVTDKRNVAEEIFNYIPRMWFNSGIRNKYIVSYNSDLELSDSAIQKKIGILVFNVINSNEVYINGKLIGSRGHVDKDINKIKNNASPAYYRIPDSILKKGANRITIRIADAAMNGGFLEAPKICIESICEQYYNKFLILTGGVGFFLLFIGIYYIILYFSNKLDKSVLFFGAAVFSYSLNFIGMERLIYFFTDEFLWQFYAVHFGYIFTSVFTVLFIHSFLDYKLDKTSKLILISLGLSTISTIFASIFIGYRKFNGNYVFLFNLLIVIPALSIQILRIILISFKERHSGSTFVLIGFSILIFTALLIPLHILHIIPTKQFTLEGSIIFILAVSLALSKKTKDTSEKLLSLKMNYSLELEEKVNIKTKELEINNQELIKSNLMKDKLFSIIAHDLRNPLFALEEIILLFQDKHLTLKNFQKSILSLGENLENNRFLLENLLQWSYIQLGYAPAKLELINMQAVISECLLLYKGIANQKNIQVLIENKKQMQFKVDEGIIKIILRNFLSNAIKFTRPKGKILINFGKRKKINFIEVKDNGIGIPKERLKNLFKELQNKKRSKGTLGEEGSGIGLTLCKDFADRMNAAIKISSTEKEGSIFRLEWNEYDK